MSNWKMADVPKVASTPLEVLDNNREFIKTPFLLQYWGPGVGAVVGLISVGFSQWALRRPLLSGLQRYVGASVGLAVVGKYVYDYRQEYFAERDAMFRHYIELHPEDFPPFKRVKYADILEPWVPIR